MPRLIFSRFVASNRHVSRALDVTGVASRETEGTNMDIFTRFNRKGIDDRMIDTLIGLSKGMVADGQVNQPEAEALLAWLVQSRQATDSPVVVNLLERIGTMLHDCALQPGEASELLSLLQSIAGEGVEVGELAKPATLPIDIPPPIVTFPDNSFVFTGTCVYGTRKQCQEEIGRAHV